MSYRAWFNGLSFLRRLAFWGACVLWVLWVSWFQFAFSGAAIVRWSQIKIAAFVLLGATASAVVILELVRVFLPRQWSDALHFGVLGTLIAVLFSVQYTGLRLMVQSFSQ